MVNGGNPNSTWKTGSLCVGPRFQSPGFLLGDTQALSTQNKVHPFVAQYHPDGWGTMNRPPTSLVNTKTHQSKVWLHVCVGKELY